MTVTAVVAYKLAGDEQASLTAAHVLPSYSLLVLATRSKTDALQGWRFMAAQMSTARDQAP
jgi:hypothetical protein